MINITDKHKCCGCEACAQKCPKNCIIMKTDEEGLLYPFVNTKSCIECGACERVCPELNKTQAEVKEVKTYAAYCKDEEIRLQSSSGGIFTVLAEKVIEEGGVVFGAKFDENWSVCHSYTETKEGLSAFRGSKYLQSRIGESYRQAQEFLKVGRKVLFSGTPCQIAGLKRYLVKDYPNLLAVDFVCHGVPSPLVWQKYLDTVQNYESSSILNDRESKSSVTTPFTYISFRDKRNGWKRYGIRIQSFDGNEKYETFHKNDYMKAFLSDLILRPSCYSCPVKGFSSKSDITIGDFWGIDEIDPDIDDDKGMSLIFIHNNSIITFLNQDKIFIKEERYENGIRHNPSILYSVSEPLYRSFFFWKMGQSNNLSTTYEAIYSTSIFKRIERKIWLILNKK